MIDAIDLTRELVRIPSLNPPGDEERCARYLAGLLADAGFAVRLDTFGPRRFNLTASLAGSNGGKPRGLPATSTRCRSVPRTGATIRLAPRLSTASCSVAAAAI